MHYLDIYHVYLNIYIYSLSLYTQEHTYKHTLTKYRSFPWGILASTHNTIRSKHGLGSTDPRKALSTDLVVIDQVKHRAEGLASLTVDGSSPLPDTNPHDKHKPCFPISLPHSRLPPCRFIQAITIWLICLFVHLSTFTHAFTGVTNLFQKSPTSCIVSAHG